MPNVAEGPRRFRSLRSRLLLAMASLAFALVAAEVAMRFMTPLGTEFALDATNGRLPPGLFQNDPELKVTLAPDVTVSTQASDSVEIRTNALGIRGGPLSDKAADELRVLAIGDSFTLGMQVAEADTFSAILSDRLTQVLNRTVSVLNAGVPGYGTDQARMQMERLVTRTQADAVLLTVYAGNDLRDNARWGQTNTRPETPPPVRPPPPQRRSLWRSMARHSRIAAYIQLTANLDALANDFRIQEYRDELLPFADSSELSKLMPATRTALKRFGDACTTLGVPCVIAIAPPAYAVHTERVDRTFAAFGLEPRDARLDAPGMEIRSAVPNGLAAVDLTPALRRDAASDPYMLWDPHWSANGHRIAADAMNPLLQPLLQALP